MSKFNTHELTYTELTQGATPSRLREVSLSKSARQRLATKVPIAPADNGRGRQVTRRGQ